MPLRSPGSAAGALSVASVASAVLAGLYRPPIAWQQPNMSPPPPRPGPVGAALDSWIRAIAVGQQPQREEVVATLLVVAVATATAWVAHRLFRGPGRDWAAACCGPLVAWSLLHWLGTTQPLRPAGQLLFTLFALGSIGVLVRSLMRAHRMTALTSVRTLFLGTCAALVDPVPGLPLLLVLTMIALARGGAHGSPVRIFEAVKTRGTWMIASVFMVGLVAPLGAVMGSSPMESYPDLRSWHVTAPTLQSLQNHLSGYLLLPGLAFVALLVIPLRWRGGLALAGLLGLGLSVHDHQGTVTPFPTLLAATAAASTGWIWLAGTIMPKRRWVGMASSAMAAATVVTIQTLAAGDTRGWLVHRPLAHTRPTSSLVHLYARGLLAPGDTILAVDPWLFARMQDLQSTEGFRPDVQLVAVGALNESDLSAITLARAGEGRRILSDSFNLAGRWRATWAVDSGPLYWFVGSAAVDNDQYVDLSRLAPEWIDPIPAEAQRWERMHVERVRFRRARNAIAEAVAALPYLDQEQRRLLAHHETEFPVERGSEPVSELPPISSSFDHVPGTITLAEAGDLLWSGGASEAGAAMLASSAERGFNPAWGALARWQLQAGRDRAARETLASLANTPELRGEAIHLIDWLLDRGRIEEAEELRDDLVPADLAVVEELGARLAILSASAKRKSDP